jgi:hypothetical protein
MKEMLQAGSVKKGGPWGTGPWFPGTCVLPLLNLLTVEAFPTFFFHSYVVYVILEKT